MYTYRIDQPPRREIDGPFKGQLWQPGKRYTEVPEHRIYHAEHNPAGWFIPVQGLAQTEAPVAEGRLPEVDASCYGPDAVELDAVLKKNSAGDPEPAGPELDNTGPGCV